MADVKVISFGLHGGFPTLGVPLWGPYNKDDSILESKWGSPYFRKLRYKSDTSIQRNGGREKKIETALWKLLYYFHSYIIKINGWKRNPDYPIVRF